MILTVKLLLGRRCSVKVSGQESVATLKKLVSQQLQVPEEQQHLLFLTGPSIHLHSGLLLASSSCIPL
uniref:Ubiquitin-like domain-containing protein n=1 Tax=Oryctolagus cuniculus TaxID=9986 RepID=G1SXT9_RABIT